MQNGSLRETCKTLKSTSSGKDWKKLIRKSTTQKISWTFTESSPQKKAKSYKNFLMNSCDEFLRLIIPVRLQRPPWISHHKYSRAVLLLAQLWKV